MSTKTLTRTINISYTRILLIEKKRVVVTNYNPVSHQIKKECTRCYFFITTVLYSFLHLS